MYAIAAVPLAEEARPATTTIDEDRANDGIKKRTQGSYSGNKRLAFVPDHN
jgi:hypothetical protein